jgi:hypothetical protein
MNLATPLVGNHHGKCCSPFAIFAPLFLAKRGQNLADQLKYIRLFLELFKSSSDNFIPHHLPLSPHSFLDNLVENPGHIASWLGRL